MNSKIRTLITENLRSSRSSWSVGVRGAIAEFLRTGEEMVHHESLEHLAVATARGAIKIFPLDAVRQIRHQNAVHFCLPEAPATLSTCNKVLTELGADTESVSGDHDQDILFDLGLGIEHVRVCVRTAEGSLLTTLREHAGQPLLGPDRGLLHILAATSPHRVFISNLARVEVYGPIPTDHTPNGPHTHLLPQLLGTTDEPLDRLVPIDHSVCLSLYLPD